MEFHYVPSQAGLMSIADSARLLRTIFPDYPCADTNGLNLRPLVSAPVLVPDAPTRETLVMDSLVSLGVFADEPRPRPSL